MSFFSSLPDLSPLLNWVALVVGPAAYYAAPHVAKALKHLAGLLWGAVQEDAKKARETDKAIQVAKIEAASAQAVTAEQEETDRIGQLLAQIDRRDALIRVLEDRLDTREAESNAIKLKCLEELHSINEKMLKMEADHNRALMECVHRHQVALTEAHNRIKLWQAEIQAWIYTDADRYFKGKKPKMPELKIEDLMEEEPVVE